MFETIYTERDILKALAKEMVLTKLIWRNDCLIRMLGNGQIVDENDDFYKITNDECFIEFKWKVKHYKYFYKDTRDQTEEIYETSWTIKPAEKRLPNSFLVLVHTEERNF